MPESPDESAGHDSKDHSLGGNAAALRDIEQQRELIRKKKAFIMQQRDKLKQIQAHADDPEAAQMEHDVRSALKNEKEALRKQILAGMFWCRALMLRVDHPCQAQRS